MDQYGSAGAVRDTRWAWLRGGVYVQLPTNNSNFIYLFMNIFNQIQVHR